MKTTDEKKQLLRGQERVSLSDISKDDVLFFGLLNKFLIENIVSHADATRSALEENQEIFTFEIPQPRHRTLNFIRQFFGRKSKTWQPVQNNFTNHKFQLSNGILNILVKKNVTKDTHILYYTTANQILKLQNLGLTSSQALTSKIIETLGHYNLLVAQRRIKSNIVTNKTDLKQYIVSRAQLHARLLQPVERCISNHHSMTAISYAGKITIAIQTYILNLKFAHETIYNALLAIKTGNATLSPEADLVAGLGMSQTLLTSFLKYDPEFLQDLENQYEQQITDANEFLKNSINEELSASQLSDNLQGFLTYQLEETLHYAQSQNDQITAGSDDSLFRGKLKEYIMDAEYQINHYVFDQLNPITKEHQSDYRTTSAENSEGENKVLYQSMVHVGRSKEDQEKVLIGITTLNDPPETSFQPPIRIVKSAGWNNYSSRLKGQKLNRFLAWGLTTICHAPLGMLNILITGISGQSPVADWMQKVENYFQEKYKIVNDYNSNFTKYCDKLGGNNLYTSTLIGRLLHKIIHEVTAVAVQAPLNIYEKITKQSNSFLDDFRTGLWKNHISSPSAEQEFSVFEKTKSNEDVARLEHWLQTARKLNKINYYNLLDNRIEYATVKNSLDPYYPHDLLSSVTHALTGFLEFFKDEVFEKHPVTGFIAALAYAFGGAAVMAPTTLKLILGHVGFTQTQANIIITACQELGRPIAKSGINQAIASGFTLAKIMGISINTTSQGFDSALAKVISEISKEPLLYGIGIGLSYGFGNLLTSTLQVPYLTNFLNEDIGTVPAISRILIGAKLGMLSLEAALPEDELHRSILAEFMGDVSTNFMIAIRIMLTPFSLSTQPYKDGWNQLKKALGIFTHVADKIITTGVQMIILIPKTLLEVATTLFVNLAKLINQGVRNLPQNRDHAVPIAGPILRFKNAILHTCSHITFFVAELSRRRAERFCGRLVKGINHHVNSDAQDYNAILTRLNGVQLVESAPPTPQPLRPELLSSRSRSHLTLRSVSFSLALARSSKDCKTEAVIPKENKSFGTLSVM